MAIYLDLEKQSRFNTLLALFSTGEISDEQEQELITLRKELQRNKAGRAEKLGELKSQIDVLGVAIDELYSVEAIAATADRMGLSLARTTASKNKATVPRPSDSSEVLLILRIEPGVKGPREWHYRQGRIYERASPTMTLPWAMRERQFPGKLLKAGISTDALRPHFTPAGTAYFATAPGQAELAKLVEVTLEARRILKVE